jgi:cyclohexyl-isocyanide hydratase
MSESKNEHLDRRTFTRLSMAALTAGWAGQALAGAREDPFGPLRTQPLTLGLLIFPGMDQIDFTGPFSVLSRIPDATVQVLARQPGPLRDHKGLILTPDRTLEDSPSLDLLLVPGGPGQEALMDDELVLSFIRKHVEAGKLVFSVCTGALICGAAGVLRGRRVTTHWAAMELLPHFGAVAVDQRVVVDGPLISAAGVTAGIDGALKLAALLRGDAVAQRIQLDIQYAPEPPFQSGSPHTAPRDVLRAVKEKYQPLRDAREATARRVAERLGIGSVPRPNPPPSP